MIPDPSAPGFEGLLFASLAIGCVGLGLLLYGKKQRRWPQSVAGIVLMFFPYFVSSLWWMLGIAAAAVGILVFVLRLGW